MRESKNPLLLGIAGIERDENFLESNVACAQCQPRPHRPRRIVLVADHELQGHAEQSILVCHPAIARRKSGRQFSLSAPGREPQMSLRFIWGRANYPRM